MVRLHVLCSWLRKSSCSYVTQELWKQTALPRFNNSILEMKQLFRNVINPQNEAESDKIEVVRNYAHMMTFILCLLITNNGYGED